MYPATPYFPYNTFPQFDRSFILEDQLISIRHSNTIFSTMVCPKCEKRLAFEVYSTDELVACCPDDDYEVHITLRGLITLLNNNGLNQLVTPPKPVNIPVNIPEETKQCEDISPPDGFKVEPMGDD